jgi:hypothetical protein
MLKILYKAKERIGQANLFEQFNKLLGWFVEISGATDSLTNLTTKSSKEHRTAACLRSALLCEVPSWSWLMSCGSQSPVSVSLLRFLVIDARSEAGMQLRHARFM